MSRAAHKTARTAGFAADGEFARGKDMFEPSERGVFESDSGRGFGAAKGASVASGSRPAVAGLRRSAEDAAVEELDDSDELEGVGEPYRAARGVSDFRRRRAERSGDGTHSGRDGLRSEPGADANGGQGRSGADAGGEAADSERGGTSAAQGAGKGAVGGAADRSDAGFPSQTSDAPPSAKSGMTKHAAKRASAEGGAKPPVMEQMQMRRNFLASRSAAQGAVAEEAAMSGARKGAGRGIAAAVVHVAPAVGMAVGAVLAVVVAALAVSQIVGALFGFWTDEASQASLEGLPPYITTEMVEAALECQEKYGHPAGCTLAQIIAESGLGDHLSMLATRDHNLFGMKWSSSFGGCPEVAGKSSWGTSEEYGGQRVSIVADFVKFEGDAECIRFRSRVFLQASTYSGNAKIRQAMKEHDSDLMAEGLQEAGWATDSSYAESLKTVMETYGLYAFDGMSVEDFRAGGDAEGKAKVIVEAAKSQLGVPYVWGGSTPGKGLDCSGLTQYCYRMAGVQISHYTEDQLNELSKIPLSQAKAGDILYRPGHVAIYLGGDRYIHEPHTGDHCRIATGVGSFTCALTYRK